MKRYARYLTLLSTLLWASSARAQSGKWVKIGDVGGEESSSFVDTSNVVRANGFAVVQIALRFAKGHTPPNFVAGTSYTITLYEFDCAARKFRVGAGKSFSASGKVLNENGDSNFSEWIDPQPMTIGEGVTSGVCAILKQSGQ